MNISAKLLRQAFCAFSHAHLVMRFATYGKTYGCFRLCSLLHIAALFLQTT